jgi:hypothetical protein
MPGVGEMVHYVSYGSPGGEYGKHCRAAFVTEVSDTDPQCTGLAVLNPTGLFFRSLADGGCSYADPGAETPSSALYCSNAKNHGNPFRYCACGWIAAEPQGGTWHWPERTNELPERAPASGYIPPRVGPFDVTVVSG